MTCSRGVKGAVWRGGGCSSLSPHQYHSNSVWTDVFLVLLDEVFCLGKLPSPSSSHVRASGSFWTLGGVTPRTAAGHQQATGTLCVPATLALPGALTPGKSPAFMGGYCSQVCYKVPWCCLPAQRPFHDCGRRYCELRW